MFCFQILTDGSIAVRQDKMNQSVCFISFEDEQFGRVILHDLIHVQVKSTEIMQMYTQPATSQSEKKIRKLQYLLHKYKNENKTKDILLYF